MDTNIEEKEMKTLELSKEAERSDEEKFNIMVRSGRYEVLLRMMGLILSLVAAVVAGTNKDTQDVPITVVEGLPPLHLSLTAKWNYMSSTVYLVIVNGAACAYAATSMVLPALMDRSRRKWRGSIIVATLDLIMVALLFSANGASAAVGIIALNGNSHTQWHKVCYAFKRYCFQGGAALVISMLSSFLFLLLVMLFTFTLTSHNNRFK